jgi:outer membrane protein assembly factor BamA
LKAKHQNIENLSNIFSGIKIRINSLLRSLSFEISQIKTHFFGLFLLVIIYSCSNTKFLADDEKLYTYTWFKVKGFGRIKDKPLKAYELYKIGAVKTNRAMILLPRTKLSIYNYMKPSGTWGPRYYIHRVSAQPPVLLQTVNPEFRLKVMEQRLKDMGHFDSHIDLDLKIYGKYDKKARAKYNVYFKPAYIFNKLEFYPKHKKVDSIIAAAIPNSLIVTGKDYWVSTLESERKRLNTTLKNNGYFFFNPDYILFHADTTIGNKKVDLAMVVKDGIPEKAFNQYTVKNINVYVKSNRKSTKSRELQSPVYLNNCFYTSDEKYFRPKIITRAISIKPDKHYSLRDHDNTKRYLQGMEAFRTVNVTYNEVDSATSQLDAHIELIPLKPIQTSLEVNFATKSNDFVGPSAKASVSHMNLFRGAEQLTLQIDGGFEWQKRSKRKEYELGLNSYEIGTQLKLVIPRFLTPFRIKGQSARYVPKTYTSIGFRSLKRVRYYSMNLSQVKFGYSWRTSPSQEYRIEPASIDYLHLTETSEDFNAFLLQYPQVAKSFEEQLIPGSLFSFTYSANPKRKIFNKFYYNGVLDLAGNLVSSIYRITGSKENNPDEPQELFGAPYAQYVRITNDLRYYIHFNAKNQIAARLIAGIGIPYHNSTVLPYVKQFVAGGSHDNRAFYARSIGPGSYQPVDSLQGGVFLDQSGDIKLAGNIEYRFPITYRTNGALFFDAGNVWLLNEDETRQGGKFEFNRFMNEIALGAGLGIRIDIDYFIIRFDAAVPIRKPYISGPDKWIFNDTSFFGEYILSLAVGYPF